MQNLAKPLLLLLIFSLGFMKPSVRLLGFSAVPTDVVFPLLAAAWAAAVLTRRVRFRWNGAYWLIIAYLAALAASILASAAPLHSALKLATVVYLALLAVLADQLTESEADLRACLRAWVAASAVVALTTFVALAAFAFDPEGLVARYTRFHYGTLPPGAYPRFSLTFLNANMLCDYLTVSVGVLLALGGRGWIGERPRLVLLAGVLFASLFTISPGLGGILLLLGLWLWLVRRDDRPAVAKLGLASGLAAAALFVAATAVTPILHSTAPFLIRLPGLTLAPAGRFLVWMDAVRNFAAHPLFGHGIGVDAVHVRYLDPSGFLQTLTDAHNTFLSIAAQAGLLGLIALVMLLVGAFRRTQPLRLLPDGANALRLGLGLAFLVAFFYEGLGGSFEDGRHLWVLFGLFLAACRVEAQREGPPPAVSSAAALRLAA